MQQRLTELTLESVGHYGAPYFRGLGEGDNEHPIGPDYAHRAAPTYFNMRKTTIYGGSNQLQRHIIAKLLLGLCSRVVPAQVGPANGRTRSEGRRCGTECVSKCRTRWWADHSTKKRQT